MSIPPLVCSTPPPPDQCVDEKDHDDFGLQYNLSQDEEDDNYDYMGFSPYNHCHPQTPIKQNTSSVSKDSTVEPSVPHTKEIHNVNGITDFIQQDVASKTTAKDNMVSSKATDFIQDVSPSPSKTNTAIDAKEISNIATNYVQDVSPSNSDTTINAKETSNIEQTSPSEKINEDEILEDLNLEVDEEVFSKKTGEKTNTFKNETEISCDVNISNEVNENIPTINNQEIDNNVTITTMDIKDEIEHSNIQIVDQIDGPPTYIDELIENESININNLNSDNLHTEPIQPLTETLKQIDDIPDPVIEDQIDTKLPNENSSLETDLDFKVNPDDDFGDFDDFQFATTSNTNNPSTLAEDCDSENPWSNFNEATDDFGDFKANFNQENHESNLFSKSDKQTEIEHSNTENQIKTHSESVNDDDFGDFDDFKSSTEKTTDEQMHQQYPVLNLQSSETETQIMESINKVLNSIFLDEIIEQEMEYTKLESHLGVTWNHLLEVDTRQPYIVNWNNSLGQKTLLKALCIDSRNILFGSKWSLNMPKYATNLTAAPLQPQKQTTSVRPSNETTVPANSVSKSTWSDPFTSQGQESVTIGSSSDHPPLEIGPTDLDVFEAASSSKPDKIYSSAPNVQSIRQINLPDTHIFTPTDSETPRSKTIHYEGILLPQTAIGVTEKISQTTDNIDNEYWEFQDFKCTASTQPEVQVTKSNATSSEVAVSTQVLQPVKIEPTIPTLNWPNPGDINETFEDFSDFVSNSTWSDKQEIPAVKPETGLNTEPASNLTQTKKESVQKSEFVSNPMAPQTNIPETCTFDDEFDTFQSALPPKVESSAFPQKGTSDFAFDCSSSKAMPQPQPKMLTESDTQLPFTNQKSDVISFPNYSGSSKTPSVFLATNATKSEPVKSSSMQPISLQASVLQPMPATSTKNQNTSQILQPLSLESYSQINWPNPGIDLQDLSRFNPVETLNSLKTDLSTNSSSKNSSPVHSIKVVMPDDDWGDFVSSKPKHQPKKSPTFADDDEWSDFVSSPSVKPQNGLNTISLNVSTNVNVQKNKLANKNPQMPYDIPTLNYITPKTSSHQYTTDRHFQNL